LHGTPEGGILRIKSVNTLPVGKSQMVDEALVGDDVSCTRDVSLPIGTTNMDRMFPDH
jgi:hypothetical protein